MNFNHLDFLVYSSHKTSTQSLVQTLVNNNYTATHCHTITDFNLRFYDNIRNNKQVTPEIFIEGLNNYKEKHNKKIKIITAIRNPKDRLISSFFQSFYTDEIAYLHKAPQNTTVNLNDPLRLCMIYESLVTKKRLRGSTESIDEMSSIFRTDIIQSLEKKDNYYYFEHDLFELFVLDFNVLISPSIVGYLNQVLKLNLQGTYPTNLSKDKPYYLKYKTVKKMIGNRLDQNIENNYNLFYFAAFL